MTIEDLLQQTFIDLDEVYKYVAIPMGSQKMFLSSRQLKDEKKKERYPKKKGETILSRKPLIEAVTIWPSM